MVTSRDRIRDRPGSLVASLCPTGTVLDSSWVDATTGGVTMTIWKAGRLCSARPGGIAKPERRNRRTRRNSTSPSSLHQKVRTASAKVLEGRKLLLQLGRTGRGATALVAVGQKRPWSHRYPKLWHLAVLHVHWPVAPTPQTQACTHLPGFYRTREQRVLGAPSKEPVLAPFLHHQNSHYSPIACFPLLDARVG